MICSSFAFFQTLILLQVAVCKLWGYSFACLVALRTQMQYDDDVKRTF